MNVRSRYKTREPVEVVQQLESCHHESVTDFPLIEKSVFPEKYSDFRSKKGKNHPLKKAKSQKFVFVASEPRDIMFNTFGQALEPLEYAIVGTLDDRLRNWLRQDRFTIGVATKLSWDGEPIRPADWILRFIETAASKVVVGVYRTSMLAPVKVFYAHEDHSEIAAHIAIADSMLHEQGGPMLLQTANRVCNAIYGGSLDTLVEQGYVNAGAHHRFAAGRSHRIR